MQMDITGFEGAQTRRQASLQRTRRFAFVGAALAAAALLIATTVSFTAQNSSVSVSSITGGSTAIEVKDGLTTTTTPQPEKWAVSAGGSKTNPAWSPVIGEPVSTGTTGGDLIVIDSRGNGNNVTITVALQNAGDLASGYSTFILPVGVREAGGTIGTTTTWSTVPSGGETQYLTLSSPVATFTVAGSKLYEVIVPGSTDAGVVVASSTTNLTPKFLIQAH